MAFVWGVLCLVYTLQLYGVDTNRGSWTFGQVISIVVLVAPLISILDISLERKCRNLLVYLVII